MPIRKINSSAIRNIDAEAKSGSRRHERVAIGNRKAIGRSHYRNIGPMNLLGRRDRFRAEFQAPPNGFMCA